MMLGHVEFRGVQKRFDQRRSSSTLAVDHVDLSVRQGEFVSIIGKSGCGKSTLLRIAAGLIPPTEGTVLVDGQRVDGPVPHVGFVFQEPVLMQWRTVLANVMLPSEILPGQADSRGRALRLLDMAGLRDFADHRPHELSGGMRQRVAICRALMTNPQLLLMDEPFGALDAMTRDEMGEELLALWTRNPLTVLFVTHSIEEAVYLSDRVLVLSGRPATVRELVSIDLPRPRGLNLRYEPVFGTHAAYIRELVANSDNAHARAIDKVAL